MKKTIAILLILVIGMVGVFADDYNSRTTLELTTDVEQLTGFRITTTSITDGHDYSAFTGLTDLTTVVVDLAGLGEEAYLTAANNSSTQPYKIRVLGVEMSDSDVDTKIRFTFTVGLGEGIESIAKKETYLVEDFTEVMTVSGTTTNGMQVDSSEITVALIANDFNSAAPGSYVGSLIFEVVTP